MKNQELQSIYDLADRVGVSASTVSRVLNGRDGIGEATRQRVLSAARAAGFRPRMTARSLTVALVVDRNQFVTFGGFVSTLMSHVVHVLARHDVAVELITEHSFARLRDRLIDGVLAMAWDDSTIEELRKLPDVPVVTMNRMDTSEFSAVATNHRRQGEMAVDYLYGRGHRRIAMVSEERDNWGSLERVAGFSAAMKRNGLEMAPDCVVFTDHQPMYGVMRRLLTGYNPTALFVAGEDLGLEASYILRDVLGLKVPRDMSLLGMESSKVSQFLAPPMTTLCQPLEELAERSLEVLLQQMDGRKAAPQRVILENTLIERESVATLTAG
jgi:DNA-binding LacI/PurR family transcriptional regulator